MHSTSAPDDDEVIVNHVVSPRTMMFLGLRLLQYRWRRLKAAKVTTNYNRFKSHYGVSPVTAAWVYEDLQVTDIEEAKVKGDESDLKGFLMAQHYLRKYPTEEDMVARFEYCAYWAREKVWAAVKKIRALKREKIVWDEDHFRDEKWIMTVDGVHSWMSGPNQHTPHAWSKCPPMASMAGYSHQTLGYQP
jgi:hypothetical protein